ncbi:YdeI family protein [Streptomyces sp. NBC_00878]|uniref:YdeI/OmpD-associated family protein n=1 Tax=Streptomyces sp. NBC_00878 TaxID=2975854 RepID=UPI002253B3DF|nr:YdeI/OmpD-associated family protein [Streptomyces sp. NBC_00878]MCX4905170.1 YdeI/OmpD-associated family protein [Streptomyces sp. NBC_00878]
MDETSANSETSAAFEFSVSSETSGTPDGPDAPGVALEAPDTFGGLEIRTFPDAEHLDAWISARSGLRGGVWLKVAKKGSGLPSVTVAEALDVALCHGWIDGQRRRLDESYFLQKYTPRRPGSLWSMVNVRKVEALTEAGRMRPAGLAEVAAAKADGRWEAAYESQRNATVPDDLAAALDRSPRAKTCFEGLGRTGRYQVILGLLTARTPEVRAARLDKAIARLEKAIAHLESGRQSR